MYGRFRCALIELPFKRTDLASCRNAEKFTFVGRFTERVSFLRKICRVVQSRLEVDGNLEAQPRRIIACPRGPERIGAAPGRR